MTSKCFFNIYKRTENKLNINVSSILSKVLTLFLILIEQQEEWMNRDLVVDPRETWKHFFKRQLNFEDPPLVPREELPETIQPHRSFYGKLSCFLNNIDPYPPKPREQGNLMDITNNSVSARTPLNDMLTIKRAVVE